MTQDIQEVEKLVQDNGTNQALVIIFLAILICLLIYGLNKYTKSEEYKRKKDEEDEKYRREKDQEINKNYIEMIRQLTETVTKNTSDILGFKEGLSLHADMSDKNFEKVHGRFDELEKKVDIIEDTTKEVATKTMVNELKDDIKIIREQIKKD